MKTTRYLLLCSGENAWNCVHTPTVTPVKAIANAHCDNILIFSFLAYFLIYIAEINRQYLHASAYVNEVTYSISESSNSLAIATITIAMHAVDIGWLVEAANVRCHQL
jgi:hypothetical protein